MTGIGVRSGCGAAHDPRVMASAQKNVRRNILNLALLDGPGGAIPGAGLRMRSGIADRSNPERKARPLLPERAKARPGNLVPLPIPESVDGA